MEQKIKDKQKLISQEKQKQVQLKKVMEEIEQRNAMGIGEGRSLMMARRAGRQNRYKADKTDMGQVVKNIDKRNVFSPPITRNEQNEYRELQKSMPNTKSAPKVGFKNNVNRNKVQQFLTS